MSHCVLYSLCHSLGGYLAISDYLIEERLGEFIMRSSLTLSDTIHNAVHTFAF